MRRHKANALESAWKQLPKPGGSWAAEETSPQVIAPALPAGDVIVRPEPSLCLCTHSSLKPQALIYWKAAPKIQTALQK